LNKFYNANQGDERHRRHSAPPTRWITLSPENGNVIRQTDWIMDVSNSYDALNRVTMSTETPRDTTDYPANTMTYAYDIAGKRTNLEFQVSSFQFQTGYTYGRCLARFLHLRA